MNNTLNSSVLLHKFHLKQLIYLTNLNINQAEKLLEKIYKKILVFIKSVKKKLQNPLVLFFEILFTSLIFSILNNIKKKTYKV